MLAMKEVDESLHVVIVIERSFEDFSFSASFGVCFGVPSGIYSVGT